MEDFNALEGQCDCEEGLEEEPRSTFASAVEKGDVAEWETRLA